TVVVETDGAIEQSDILSSAHHGAAATGLHVAHDTFDAVLRVPVFTDRQQDVAGLSRTCQQCNIRRTCGAGLYAHRYRSGSGFIHPSVYCPDLYRLITYIRRRLINDISTVRKRTS
ncbi:MAG: radical SAM protein, partial [Actinobacteria bacterium]|nr:radical SAM protein [Actinomycetota bacterium]